MSRAWGFWTRGKLHVLRDYLNAFTTTTKYKAGERIYLDLFAGETENLDIITHEEIESSAHIALSIDEPPFTRLRFFELEGKAQELERSLVRPENEAAIDDVFGIGAWREIYKARLNETLSGREAHEEYLNLMRWHLEAELGYRWTHPLELKNTHGTSLYFMIFATSNDAGHKIMSHLYNTAAAQFPAMQAEARSKIQQMEEEQSGVTRLFDIGVDPPMSDSHVEHVYMHEPPTQPWFLGDDLV